MTPKKVSIKGTLTHLRRLLGEIGKRVHPKTNKTGKTGKK